MNSVRTIDAHVCGSAVRLVVEGFPSLAGCTPSEQLASARRRADRIRQFVMNEPRGHADMTGAVLIQPAEPGADAGVLFMDGAGFRALSGHGILAVATIALDRGLLLSRDTNRVVFDTAAGTVRVRLDRSDDDHAGRATMTGVPSFVVQPGLELLLPGRRLRADIAFGGGFYAIVDAESAGVPVDGAHLGDLRRTGLAVAAAVDAAMDLVHPLNAGLSGLTGTIFTAPPRAEGAALRSVVVRVDGAVERSPSGTGTAAVMAVLDAMGLLLEGLPFVHEGLTGHCFDASVATRTQVGEHDAIVPAIAAQAWVTGEHLFVSAADDPFPEGFRLS